MMSTVPVPADEVSPRWVKVLDQGRCIGCHACTTACKSENQVPVSVTRTYVKAVEVGQFPDARRHFQVTRCNQCADAPCVQACPTSAMFKRPDGIVDFSKQICIGCKACIAACPYDAIFINPEDHAAEKCNFCAHRIDQGLEPACVVVCPTEAIAVGNVNDPDSRVSEVLRSNTVAVRAPEKGTGPQVYYRGAHQATLDPLVARRPSGGLFMWSEQRRGAQHVVSGHPRPERSAALLAYDVAHQAPWDWRVSAYTWTKGVAAGVYLAGALLVLAGVLDSGSALWTTAVPLVGLVSLAITGVLLIADLEHPERFYLIFTRPQWRSWLVRGAFIIAGYGAVLAVHLIVAFAGFDAGLHRALLPLGAVLALATAVYTAFLFAQSRGRDLWHSPLLSAHFAIEAVLAGGAVLALAAVWQQPDVVRSLLALVAGGAVVHLGLIAAEVVRGHPTAHARLAVDEMVRGRYARWFWAGLVAITPALLAPWLGVLALPCLLVGLALYEHAFVQAGQVVPLA